MSFSFWNSTGVCIQPPPPPHHQRHNNNEHIDHKVTKKLDDKSMVFVLLLVVVVVVVLLVVVQIIIMILSNVEPHSVFPTFKLFFFKLQKTKQQSNKFDNTQRRHQKQKTQTTLRHIFYFFLMT